MVLLAELVALNFTVPDVFVSASADKVPSTAVTPLVWIEPSAIVTGIWSASAFPALSVASTTIVGGSRRRQPNC